MAAGVTDTTARWGTGPCETPETEAPGAANRAKPAEIVKTHRND